MAAALAAARRLWVPAVLGQRPVSTGASGGGGGMVPHPSGPFGNRAAGPAVAAGRCALIGQLSGGAVHGWIYSDLVGGDGAAGRA